MIISEVFDDPLDEDEITWLIESEEEEEIEDDVDFP